MVALIASLALLPPPEASEAQTAGTYTTIWSGTLTVAQVTDSANFLGCTNHLGSAVNFCTHLDPPGRLGRSDKHARFVYDGGHYDVSRVLLDTSANELIVTVERTNSLVPHGILRSGRLSVDGTDYQFVDSVRVDNQTRKWSVPGLVWTAGQRVSLSLSVRTDAEGVSNLEQPGGFEINGSIDKPWAVAFGTGAAAGYAVTSVTIEVGSCTTAQLGSHIPTVEIRALDAGTGTPGALVGALTSPSAAVHGSAVRATYTPSSRIELSRSTRYFLVVPARPTTTACILRATNNDDETGSPGWNIGDQSNVDSGSDSTWNSSAGDVFLFAVDAERAVTSSLRQEYDWCYNRMSEQACAEAIGRWATQAEEIDLPGPGHCPATHQIRKVTSSGRKCEQSYDPLPPGGALAEAWGVTEIAPPAETTDTWDGTERPCHQQGHGYYVLPTNRHHGLGKGCHYHNGTRQDLGNVQWSGHHEHKFVNRH